MVSGSSLQSSFDTASGPTGSYVTADLGSLAGALEVGLGATGGSMGPVVFSQLEVCPAPE